MAVALWPGGHGLVPIYIPVVHASPGWTTEWYRPSLEF